MLKIRTHELLPGLTEDYRGRVTGGTKRQSSARRRVPEITHIHKNPQGAAWSGPPRNIGTQSSDPVSRRGSSPRGRGASGMRCAGQSQGTCPLRQWGCCHLLFITRAAAISSSSPGLLLSPLGKQRPWNASWWGGDGAEQPDKGFPGSQLGKGISSPMHIPFRRDRAGC